jgi:hypothetical protein
MLKKRLALKFGACAGLGLVCLQKVGWWAGLFGGKEGLLGDSLFFFWEVYGYVDVVLGFLFLAGLFAGPEEGPADCPEDEDDGEEEKDE